MSRLAKTFLILMIFAAVARMQAQPATTAGTEKIDFLLLEGKADSALMLALEMASKARRDKAWSLFLTANTQAIKSLRKLKLYDSAFRLMIAAEKYVRPFRNKFNREYASLMSIGITVKYFDGRDKLEVIDVTKDLIPFSDGISAQNRKFADSLKHRTYQFLGLMFLALDILDYALPYFDSAMVLSTSIYGDKSFETAEIYRRLAIVNKRIGDYEKAYGYLVQNFAILNEILPPNDPQRVFSLESLGLFWIDTSDDPRRIAEGINFLRKALAILDLEEEKNINTFKAEMHWALAKAYRKNHNQTRALSHIEEALAIFKNEHSKVPMEPGLVTAKAEILFDLGRYAEALKLVEALLDHDAKGGYKQVADNYILQGDIFAAQGRFGQALRSYHFSLLVLLPEGADSTDLMKPVQLAQANPDETLLTALTKFAQTKTVLFARTRDEQLLRSALDNYTDIAQYLRHTRRMFINSFSKIRFKDRTSFLYEEGIDCALQLYALTKDQTFIASAFQLADEHKYSLMLDQLEDFRIKQALDIDPMMLAEEKRYTNEIAIISKELHVLHSDLDKKDFQLRSHEKRLFEATQQLAELVKKIENKYPGYYHLKYNPNHIDLVARLNKLIPDDHLVIQYFMGKSNLCAFTFLAGQWTYQKIKRDARLDSLLLNHISLVKSKATADFAHSAHKVYEAVLSPIIQKLPSFKSMTIIPDGTLSYIPFESLIVSPPVNKTSFKTFDYLIRHYETAYNFSASLMLFNQDNLRQNGERFIGFAPDTDLAAAGLFHHREEVRQIAQLMDGQLREGNKATETSFKREGPSFGILHVASHTSINNDEPLFSRIFFSGFHDPDEDGILYTYELFSLKLDANLVALSACNTGSGKLYKNEGIMSLGTGFAYAGASNLMVSLWDVSDQPSKDLMTFFYEEVENGASYSRALHLSKLKYLDQSDNITADPNLWSGYIIIGQPAADAVRWRWIVVSFLVVFTLIFVARKWRRFNFSAYRNMR